ncbi:MAG TPA: hypothetical protein VFX92_10675 [Candidatus Krumholzibacteria bacterium]|nr:hypothetical protein [Candidatus Krumholzibacteria bacterium]
MERIVVAALIGVGSVLMITGIVIQRRALARHGTEEGKRNVSYRRWKPSKRIGRWFDDEEGLSQYFRGQSVLSLGLTLLVAMIAYIIGRGW